MTKFYEALKEEPQTNIDRGKLTHDERTDLRSIEVQTSYVQTPSTPGKFTTIYYLEGDQDRAVKQFVRENRELLEQVDFSSNRNSIQSSVSREIYDLILHELGERVLEKYETVVLETRPDGTQWVIDRQLFENHPVRRYSQAGRSAKIPDHIDIHDLYDRFGNLISAKQLETTDIEGDGRQVLDYWRSSPDFNCIPTTTSDGELAVRKRLEENGTDD